MNITRNPAGYTLSRTFSEPPTTVLVDLYNGAGVQIGERITADIAGTTASVHIGAPEMWELDTYRIEWSAAFPDKAGAVERDTLELSDRPYFTPDDFRAYIGSNLAADVTDEEIEDARRHTEALFELSAGRAYVLRGARISQAATGASRTLVSEHPAHEVLSLKVDSVDVSVSDYNIDASGNVALTYAPPHGSIIEAHVTYGMPTPPPQLKKLAMMYAQSLIQSNTVNPRVTGETNEFGGYYRYTIAGRDGATGIPEVDTFLSTDPTIGGTGVSRRMIG